jgi:hypothetical protein
MPVTLKPKILSFNSKTGQEASRYRTQDSSAPKWALQKHPFQIGRMVHDSKHEALSSNPRNAKKKKRI